MNRSRTVAREGDRSMNNRLFAVGAALLMACSSGKSSETSAGAGDSSGSERASIDTSDITLEAGADPRANMGGYTRYAWLGAGAELNDPEGRWQPPDFDVGSELKFLIDRELRAKGMSEASEAPDMLVAFLIVVDMEAQLDALGVEDNAALAQPDAAKEASGDATQSGTEEWAVPEVGKGGLLIMMVDSRTHELVWVGGATADIKNLDGEQAKARLDYAVKGLLDKLER